MSDKFLKGRMEIEKPKSPNLSKVRVSPLKKRQKKPTAGGKRRQRGKSPTTAAAAKKISSPVSRKTKKRKSPVIKRKTTSPRKKTTEKKSTSPTKKKAAGKKSAGKIRKSAALDRELAANSPAEYDNVLLEIRDNYAKLVFYYVLKNKISATKAVYMANSRINKFFYGVEYPRDMERVLNSLDNGVKILGKYGYKKLLDKL